MEIIQWCNIKDADYFLEFFEQKQQKKSISGINASDYIRVVPVCFEEIEDHVSGIEKSA